MRIIAAVLCLIVVWIVLTEAITLVNVLIGIVVATLTVLFTRKFLPAKIRGNFSILRLVTFPFFLIWQIYVAGFQIIKVMFTGSKISIVTLKTELKEEALRIVLVDSITLTPGSILVDLDGENVILLWIRGSKEPGDLEYAETKLKSRLEKRLIKAQK
jgi:multicomponent Na+:H+ antiporter subunit E